MKGMEATALPASLNSWTTRAILLRRTTKTRRTITVKTDVAMATARKPLTSFCSKAMVSLRRTSSSVSELISFLSHSSVCSGTIVQHTFF